MTERAKVPELPGQAVGEREGVVTLADRIERAADAYRASAPKEGA